MTEITEFIENYTAADRGKNDFSWNGKHATELIDANQSFRWAVVSECLANPNGSPLVLLEHRFIADSEWTVQAWGSPHHFALLGKALLERGQCAALESFSMGFVASFDTFGACHGIPLSPALAETLASSVRERLCDAIDEKTRTNLESALELFEKLRSSTASAGWATIAPGTPVTDMKIV